MAAAAPVSAAAGKDAGAGSKGWYWGSRPTALAAVAEETDPQLGSASSDPSWKALAEALQLVSSLVHEKLFELEVSEPGMTYMEAVEEQMLYGKERAEQRKLLQLLLRVVEKTHNEEYRRVQQLLSTRGRRKQQQLVARFTAERLETADSIIHLLQICGLVSALDAFDYWKSTLADAKAAAKQGKPARSPATDVRKLPRTTAVTAASTYEPLSPYSMALATSVEGTAMPSIDASPLSPMTASFGPASPSKSFLERLPTAAGRVVGERARRKAGRQKKTKRRKKRGAKHYFAASLPSPSDVSGLFSAMDMEEHSNMHGATTGRRTGRTGRMKRKNKRSKKRKQARSGRSRFDHSGPFRLDYDPALPRSHVASQIIVSKGLLAAERPLGKSASDAGPLSRAVHRAEVTAIVRRRRKAAKRELRRRRLDAAAAGVTI